MRSKAWRWLLVTALALCLTLPAVPAFADGETIHVVRAGETLADIAWKYGTNIWTLARANGLTNVNHVWWGQRLVIPGSYSAPSAPAASSSGVHVVKAGETLADIALRYGTTVSALVQLNGLSNPNHIWWGQRLYVSGSGSSASTTPATTPAASSGVHVVQYGETLAIIAARYGTSVWALARANGLSNINHIYVGQRLALSGSGSASTSTPSSSASSGGGKWILVDLSSQTLTAFEGSSAVNSTYVSTGISVYPTPAGRFAVQYKVPSTTMSGPGYYLTGVPWNLNFGGDYFIHGAYWHNNFGTPMSHGCVNLPVGWAEWLYYWAPVGTAVVIQW
jgi:LysM repeat protein